MGNRSRAYRRFQEQKMKNKIRKRLLDEYKQSWNRNSFSKDRYINAIAVGITSCTPARCSCAMCGNPRKYFNEDTMQERRADNFLVEIEEALEEYYGEKEN